MTTGEAVRCGRPSAVELVADTRWWEIYEECFPIANEREQPAAILESVRTGCGAAFHAQENGQTVAIARTCELSDRADFLLYIGVTRSHRRRGIAAALFRSLPAQDKIFEVEDPEHAALFGVTAEACRRRIDWYRKHFGAALLDQRYLQPPLVDGCDPLPLRLMWTGEALSGEQVLDLIWSMYETLYHGVNGVAIEKVRDCYARVLEMK